MHTKPTRSLLWTQHRRSPAPAEPSVDAQDGSLGPLLSGLAPVSAGDASPAPTADPPLVPAASAPRVRPSRGSASGSSSSLPIWSER